jgi:hypothetical protein
VTRQARDPFPYPLGWEAYSLLGFRVSAILIYFLINIIIERERHSQKDWWEMWIQSKAQGTRRIEIETFQDGYSKQQRHKSQSQHRRGYPLVDLIWFHTSIPTFGPVIFLGVALPYSMLLWLLLLGSSMDWPRDSTNYTTLQQPSCICIAKLFLSIVISWWSSYSIQQNRDTPLANNKSTMMQQGLDRPKRSGGFEVLRTLEMYQNWFLVEAVTL